MSTASRHLHVSRWAIPLVALVLAGAGAAIAMTAAASTAPSLADLLGQVQRSFGDGRLLSASVDGSTLSVEVAAPDEPSAVTASFEGQILAAAARDSLSTADGPIDSVRFTDANGASVNIGTVTVADRKFSGLADGACDAAAQAARRVFASWPGHPPLTTESVLTLPYAGGSCAFTFRTSDPEAFAEAASSVIPPLDEAMGAPNERSFLMEVDDQAGTPQYVENYTWSGGHAQGVTYIKPGLSTSSIHGLPVSLHP